MSSDIDMIYEFLCKAETAPLQTAASHGISLALQQRVHELDVVEEPKKIVKHDAVAIFSRLSKDQKDKLHDLESMILDWVRQIRTVLSSSLTIY